MRSTTASFVVSVAASVLAASAYGHHSANAFYDLSRSNAVEGLVENVRWSNPHVVVEILSTDDKGVETLWRVEGDSVNALRRKGVDLQSVSIGDQVRVIGAPSRRNRPEMFAAILYLADGSEVVLVDDVAVNFGIIDEVLSTGELVTAADEAATLDELRNRIFAVWSRSYPEGYPFPSDAGHDFTDVALEAQAAWDPLTDDPGLRCEPQGMPGVIVNPYPVEFVDNGTEIILKIEEWDAVRSIDMTPDRGQDIIATPLGHSVGRWEAETLVVTTTDISWPYYDDIGTPQTNAMVVEERFTLRENGTRLDYAQSAFDPTILNSPAVLNGYFWLEEGAQIEPFDCQVGDQ